MSPRDFTFWAHGWSEINGGGAPNAQQWQIIVDHLELVRAEQAPTREPLDTSHMIVCPCGQGPRCKTASRMTVRDRSIYCGGVILLLPGPSGMLVPNAVITPTVRTHQQISDLAAMSITGGYMGVANLSGYTGDSYAVC